MVLRLKIIARQIGLMRVIRSTSAYSTNFLELLIVIVLKVARRRKLRAPPSTASVKELRRLLSQDWMHHHSQVRDEGCLIISTSRGGCMYFRISSLPIRGFTCVGMLSCGFIPDFGAKMTYMVHLGRLWGPFLDDFWAISAI